MAELLYRLGRFSARHAWTVLLSWLTILALAIGAFLIAGGTLSSSVPIPGTETARVTDKLTQSFPSASGGTGSMVFHTEDRSEFSSEQKRTIDELLETASGLAGIDTTTDPFKTASDISDQERQIADGEDQISDGRDQLSTAQEQLDAAAEQLDAAQTQLDTELQRAQQAGGLPDAVQAQFDAQQQQLDAQRTELDTQQTELSDQLADLEERARTLDLSSRLLEMSARSGTVSEDDTTALATVVFDAAQDDVTPETKASVTDHISDGLPDGVSVEFATELDSSSTEIFGVGEIVGLAVAALTLLIMLGTVIAAALPLVTAIVGVGIGVTASLAMSGVVDMISLTPVLGVMLGLAVGIDYALFILNRHRRQLLEGTELHESIGLANGTSGNAVVFAGSTVLIALLALNVTGIGFLGMMGTVGAICVAVAILLAITATPALLALIGLRVLTRTNRARIGQSRPDTAVVRPMRTGRAAATLALGLIGLLVVATPALSMRLGLPDGSSEPVDSTQYQAYQLTADKFGAGANSPLLVVAELPKALPDDEVLAEQVRIGEALFAEDDVTAVAPLGASDDATVLAFQVTPAEGPSSVSTEHLVHTLRDLSPLSGDVTLGVAGVASGNIDVSQQLADALPLYLALVVGLSLVIMIVVFRSILVPLTATIGFVLSLAATFGGLTAIFQWGWLGGVFGVHDPGPILSFLPTVLVGILFGLAMDYQLFLVSGMREAYAHGTPARLAVQHGLRAGRTVVIAAAIIMISVFGGFIFSHTTMIRSIGFGLAFGVLVDAFVIRMLLIPATMHLLGRAAWWIPRWLDRILPNIDVEGASLQQRHTARVDVRDEEHSTRGKETRRAGSIVLPQRRTSSSDASHPDVPLPREPERSLVNVAPRSHEDLDVTVRDVSGGARHVTIGAFEVTVRGDNTVVIEPPAGATTTVRTRERLPHSD